MSFNSFRDRLDTASGFQSAQFRELEFLLGYKRPDMLKHLPQHAAEHEQLLRRLHEPTVVDCFYDFLELQGVAIPAALRQRDPTQPNIPDETVAAGILRLAGKRINPRTNGPDRLPRFTGFTLQPINGGKARRVNCRRIRSASASGS